MRSRSLSISLGLLLTCASFLAHAWGPEGHRVIGDIATAYLTPAAKQQVSRLLEADLLADGKPSHRSTLGQVASWADEIRPYSWSKPYSAWHYDDLAVCGTSKPSGYCADGRCLSVQLEGQIKILSDATAPDLKRNQALKWIVHLVGDMHQPLHASDNHDKGGNDVKVSFVSGRTMNLHSLWDSAMVKQVLSDDGGEAAFESAPISPTDKANWESGWIGDWVQDTHGVGVTMTYAKLPSFSCGASVTGVVPIEHAYYAEAKPIIEAQLRKAGVRLAKVLNGALRD